MTWLFRDLTQLKLLCASLDSFMKEECETTATRSCATCTSAGMTFLNLEWKVWKINGVGWEDKNCLSSPNSYEKISSFPRNFLKEKVFLLPTAISEASSNRESPLTRLLSILNEHFQFQDERNFYFWVSRLNFSFAFETNGLFVFVARVLVLQRQRLSIQIDSAGDFTFAFFPGMRFYFQCLLCPRAHWGHSCKGIHTTTRTSDSPVTRLDPPTHSTRTCPFFLC